MLLSKPRPFTAKLLTSANDAMVACFSVEDSPASQALPIWNPLLFISTSKAQLWESVFQPPRPTIVHSPAVYNTSHPSNMNATSALELWAYDLFEPFFQIQESPHYYTITEEILGLAKANVTEHVTTLLSTQNNESIAESINYLSEVLIEYSRKQNNSEERRN